jgi:Glycosyl hydrolases family 16
MMPQDSVYGPWPNSGEIDILETRGNAPESYPMGTNLVTSSLHWGTDPENDAFQLTNGGFAAKRTKYNLDFHTFGLEWSEKYLFTWLDGRLRQVVYVDFTKNENLWTYGGFTGTTVNGSIPSDPWSYTGRANTPFDQSFYLILNVAVGGRNGYFP